MSTIRTTMVLDDQMSHVLDNIIDRTSWLNELWAQMPDYIIQTAETMEKLNEWSKPFEDARETMNGMAA